MDRCHTRVNVKGNNTDRTDSSMNKARWHWPRDQSLQSLCGPALESIAWGWVTGRIVSEGRAAGHSGLEQQRAAFRATNKVALRRSRQAGHCMELEPRLGICLPLFAIRSDLHQIAAKFRHPADSLESTSSC